MYDVVNAAGMLRVGVKAQDIVVNVDASRNVAYGAVFAVVCYVEIFNGSLKDPISGHRLEDE